MRKRMRFNIILQSLLLLSAIIPTLAFASVKYIFEVSNYPDDAFHQPFRAELIFTDSAVAAGVAYINDIESLNISAGHTMPETDPLTMDYLHQAFIDVQFNFSADKEVIVSVFARISPSMQSTDHLVLYRQRPPHPQINIHEHVGYLGRDFIRAETTLDPELPETYRSQFKGEWKREHISFIIEFFEAYLACFPFCPLPWIIIILVMAAIIGVLFLRRSRNNTRNKTE